jgi:hypothetical protein
MMLTKTLRRALAGLIAALGLTAALTGTARALPSYARQTGEPCTSCHVGAFGPQLTPHGRAFKLTGYADARDDKFRAPLSAMLVANFTHTKKDQSAPLSGHDGTNDNVALQEASVFVAGRILPHLGSFIQTTYSEIDRATAFDHADIRYARTIQTAGGKDLILGLDVNNNPTVQDPYNTIGAWSFPYTTSDLTPGRLTGAFITGGLEHQVVGTSVYADYDDHIYAEVGGYRSLGSGLLGTLGVEDEAGRLRGVAPYWRIAYNTAWKHGQSASIGLIGMSASLHPGRDGGPTNHYRDIGIDATYQYLGNRKNIFSVNVAHIWEKQRLDYSVFTEETSRRRQTLRQFNADVSWYHDQSYGLTAGIFRVSGTRDTDLFAPEEDVGSRTGDPGTNGYILQADWTPFGKEDSWLAPWANLRLGVQYTGYTRFNGARHDYDGFGRDASANNTAMLFAWLSF